MNWNCNLPTNRNNTCAIDVIVAAWLFSIDSSQFNDPDHIIQGLITSIIHLMRQPFDPMVQTNVNRMVDTLTAHVAPAFQCRQTDASEFLAMLVAKLGLDANVNTQAVQVFGTHIPFPRIPTVEELTRTSDRTEEIGAIFTIHEWARASSIHDNLHVRLDSGNLDRKFQKVFTRSITETTFMPRNPFIIHLNRAKYNGAVNHNPIEINPVINGFELRSIIIHEGVGINSGHFRALLKVAERRWMIYDDIQRQHPIREADFSRIIHDFKLDTRGILYFYG